MSGRRGDQNEPLTITECLFDPVWRTGMLQNGLTVIRLEHPRHGRIDMVLTPGSARLLMEWLVNNHAVKQ